MLSGQWVQGAWRQPLSWLLPSTCHCDSQNEPLLSILMVQDTADFSIADGDTPRWLFLSDSKRLRARVQEKYSDMVSITVARKRVLH